MTLSDDLERIASVAASLASPGERVTGILAAEPLGAGIVYLCAYESEEGAHTWLALDVLGAPVESRRVVHDAASLAALCEVAEENAFPGDLDELRAQLVALRIAEQPAGIDEAEEAALALQHVLGAAPTVATRARLDAIGIAARRLERALDPTAASPFAVAMQSSQPAVEELVREVETGYRLPLDTGE